MQTEMFKIIKTQNSLSLKIRNTHMVPSMCISVHLSTQKAYKCVHKGETLLSVNISKHFSILSPFNNVVKHITQSSNTNLFVFEIRHIPKKPSK